MPPEVVEALPGSCVVAAGVTGVAEDSVEIKILESGQCESHEGTCKDEPEYEVVASFEPDGMVDFAHGTYEGSTACFIRVRHVGPER